MNWKYVWAPPALGLLLAIGCTGGETAIDAAKLEAPVNAESIAVVRQSPQQDVASDALGRIGTPAVQPLSEALADPDPSVRIEACRALAYMAAKAKDAVPALTRTLSDSEETVREEAARALGQIGEQAQLAIPELMQMLHNKKPVER
jgi:HEAT repeat protein